MGLLKNHEIRYVEKKALVTLFCGGDAYVSTGTSGRAQLSYYSNKENLKNFDDRNQKKQNLQKKMDLLKNHEIRYAKGSFWTVSFEAGGEAIYDSLTSKLTVWSAKKEMTLFGPDDTVNTGGDAYKYAHKYRIQPTTKKAVDERKKSKPVKHSR